MFGLITLDRRTFIIVKKDIIGDNGMPEQIPFETYGFMYKQEGNGAVMFSIITKSEEVNAETASLVEQAQKLCPALSGMFYH